MTELGPAHCFEHAPPRAGDVIAARYRLEYKLGQGGMGMVFAASDLRTSRSCAVKLVRADLADSDELRKRFEREARTAAKLQAENVVAVLDLGEHAGQPYLVMELLVGADLRELINAHGPLPLPRALDLTLQACRGLEAVHAEGITHRDLKPKNVFVARHADGRDWVKVLDFGLAKCHAQQTSGASTQTGQVLGTFQYMPPEQLRGEGAGARSDVYALGAVLYEALAGHPPFESAEPHVLMHRIMYEEPKPLAVSRPGLPPFAYALVERALAKQADDRFADAQALRRAIEEAIGERVEPEADTGRAQLSSPHAIAKPRARVRPAARTALSRALLLCAALLVGAAIGARIWGARPATRAAASAEAPRAAMTASLAAPPGPAIVQTKPAPAPARAPEAVLSQTAPPEPRASRATPAARSRRSAAASRPAPARSEGLDRENPYD